MRNLAATVHVQMRRHINHRHRLLAAATVGLFFGSIAASAQTNDPRLNETVRKANSEWVEAMKVGEAAVIAAAFADEAVFTLTNGSSFVGRSAIEQMFKSRFDKVGFANATAIETTKLELEGDLAYERGTADIETLQDGKRVRSHARYSTIWQRQANGDWLILRNLVLP